MQRQGSLSTGKSSDWLGTNYEIYRLCKKEWMLYGGQGILYAGIVSFVFYRSVWIFLCLVPVGVSYPLFIRKELKKRRLETLQVQFKDAILSLASCLNAGYSVENAFAEALKEMYRVYGRESMISEEIRLVIHKIRLNRTVEEALSDFAKRSGLEDAKSFADVFLAAKGSGGELMRIITRTADIISEKTRIQQDIVTVTASRRLEQKIMSMIPILIVFYLEFASPGFFKVLYTTVIGRVIMTGCLLVYLGSMMLAERLLEISV